MNKVLTLYIASSLTLYSAFTFSMELENTPESIVQFRNPVVNKGLGFLDVSYINWTTLISMAGPTLKDYFLVKAEQRGEFPWKTLLFAFVDSLNLEYIELEGVTLGSAVALKQPVIDEKNGDIPGFVGAVDFSFVDQQVQGPDGMGALNKPEVNALQIFDQFRLKAWLKNLLMELINLGMLIEETTEKKVFDIYNQDPRVKIDKLSFFLVKAIDLRTEHPHLQPDLGEWKFFWRAVLTFLQKNIKKEDNFTLFLEHLQAEGFDKNHPKAAYLRNLCLAVAARAEQLLTTEMQNSASEGEKREGQAVRDKQELFFEAMGTQLKALEVSKQLGAFVTFKSFWLEVEREVEKIVREKYRSWPSFLTDKYQRIGAVARECWQREESRFRKLYEEFFGTLDQRKVEELGGITVSDSLKSLGEHIDYFLPVVREGSDKEKAIAQGKEDFEIDLSLIPLIGEHLEKYIDGAALVDLLKLFETKRDGAGVPTNLKRDEIIKKVIDCLRFGMLFRKKKEEPEAQKGDLYPILVVKPPHNEASESKEEAAAIQAREEGCRVLLKTMLDIYSNSQDRAAFAVNKLLTTLGEHSLHERQKAKEQKQAESEKKQAEAAVAQVNNNQPNNNNAGVEIVKNN